jgi:hypothetical protein
MKLMERQRKNRLMTPAILSALITLVILTAPRGAWTLEPIHLGLVSSAFQCSIYPIPQERGYMKEENIDLRIVMMQTRPNIQA